MVLSAMTLTQNGFILWQMCVSGSNFHDAEFLGLKNFWLESLLSGMHVHLISTVEKFLSPLFIIKITVVNWVFFSMKITQCIIKVLIWVKFISEVYLNRWFFLLQIIHISLSFCQFCPMRSSLGLTYWGEKRWIFFSAQIVEIWCASIVGIMTLVLFILVLIPVCQKRGCMTIFSALWRPTWIIYHYLIWWATKASIFY